VIANDGLAKERFGRRYSIKLAASPESGVFKFLAAPTTLQMPMANAELAEKSDPGLLDTFLKSYRMHYGLDRDPAVPDANAAAKGKPTG
jgi:hypothetical protein